MNTSNPLCGQGCVNHSRGVGVITDSILLSAPNSKKSVARPYPASPIKEVS